MTDKLEYVRMKKYDGRLYRVRKQEDSHLILVVVDGPDLWRVIEAKLDEVSYVDAYDLLGSVSPAD